MDEQLVLNLHVFDTLTQMPQTLLDLVWDIKQDIILHNFEVPRLSKSQTFEGQAIFKQKLYLHSVSQPLDRQTCYLRFPLKLCSDTF